VGTTLAAPTIRRRRSRFGAAGDGLVVGAVGDGRVDSSLIIPAKASAFDKQ
jgi:hypothetical protein